MGFKLPRRSPVDLASEVPADVAKTEEHALQFSGPGFSGKLNSSGNSGVGSALALLVLVGAANGTGYLVAQLVDRYSLHPGVAIPLVLGVGLVVLGSGLWLMKPSADSPGRSGEEGGPRRLQARRAWRMPRRRSTSARQGDGAPLG